MGVLIALIGLAFFCFIVFFIYKQIEFFVVSVGLYKKMISQQDTIISLLRTADKNKSPIVSGQIEGEVQENVTKNGEYVVIQGQSDEAYCSGCKAVTPINGMYYHKQSGRYYHEGCLPD